MSNRTEPKAVDVPIDIPIEPIDVPTTEKGRPENDANLYRLTDRRDRVNTSFVKNSLTKKFGQVWIYRPPYTLDQSGKNATVLSIDSALRTTLEAGVAFASLLAPCPQTPRCFCGSFLGVKAVVGIVSHVKQFRVCRRCGREYPKAQV